MRTYGIDTGKNGKAARVLLITDLHSSNYGSGEKRLVAAIDELVPDMILLGGDICDESVPHERTYAMLENIGRRYPCFYVTGNHEYWSGEAEKIKTKIRSFGVNVLENEHAAVDVNGEEINIYGLEDPEYFGSFGITPKWEEAFAKLNGAVDESKVNLLLSHRPAGVDYYKNSAFDVSLCGHEHGGQVRIPLVLNGIWAPDEGFFPKYAGGEYVFGHHRMIVSRGLCRNNVPRVFNRPELVLVEIK